ncbi:MAG: hypothetical protein WCI92_16030 [Bacteroidota bacterium]
MKTKMFKFCCQSCGQLFSCSPSEWKLWVAGEIEKPNLCFDCLLEQSNYEYSESSDFSDAYPGL